MGRKMEHTEHNDFETWLHGQTRNLPAPEVSEEFLAAQRRAIYRRIDQPRRNILAVRWALSCAMLLVMIGGGLTLERHRNTTSHVSPIISPISPAISDDQLFSDLSAMEQTNEPKAIQPIHGLFQE
jgi:hypothetical protein